MARAGEERSELPLGFAGVVGKKQSEVGREEGKVKRGNQGAHQQRLPRARRTEEQNPAGRADSAGKESVRVEQRGGEQLLQRAFGTRQAAHRGVQGGEGGFIEGSFMIGGGFIGEWFDLWGFIDCVGGCGSFIIGGSFTIDGSFIIVGSFILGLGIVLVNQGNHCGCQNFAQFQGCWRGIGRFIENRRERKEQIGHETAHGDLQ